MVEIRWQVGRIDDFAPAARRRQHLFVAANPITDAHAFIQPRQQVFVPAQRRAPTRHHKTRHAVDEIHLQRVQVFQPLRRHAALAIRAGFPAFFGRLVAAQVDVRRGEQVEHLIQHVLQKRKNFILPGAV